MVASLSIGAAASGEDAGVATRPPVDATLENTQGKPARLASWKGRPIVLFYEDRDSTEVNRDIKLELKEHNRPQDVQVLAVADLEGFGNIFARGFALAAVRDAEAKAGIPILVDWDGKMGSPPWDLPRRTSSVVVIDAEGKIVSKRSGRLSSEARQSVFDELSQLVADARGSPSSAR